MTDLTTDFLRIGKELIPSMNMATKEDSVYWQRVQNLRRMVINTENENWKIMWANKLRELLLNLEKPFNIILPTPKTECGYYYQLKLSLDEIANCIKREVNKNGIV
jgi:6-phosphogluconate dehydrogenase